MVVEQSWMVCFVCLKLFSNDFAAYQPIKSKLGNATTESVVWTSVILQFHLTSISCAPFCKTLSTLPWALCRPRIATIVLYRYLVCLTCKNFRLRPSLIYWCFPSPSSAKTDAGGRWLSIISYTDNFPIFTSWLLY